MCEAKEREAEQIDMRARKFRVWPSRIVFLAVYVS